MNKFFIILTSLALATSLASCKHETEPVDPYGPTPGVEEPGTPTEVGKPVGLPFTKTIGPSGGNLTTPDGLLTVEIPAGALSSPTALTLQMVEKTLPSGAGLAFTVSPQTVQLNKPVWIVWNYNATTINGSAPELVGLAYQDAQRVWQGTMNTEINKSEQTIRARVRSFAHPISWYEQYFMTQSETRILPNERVTFKVFFQPGRTDPYTGSDDDLFVPLGPLVEGDDALDQLEGKELKNWKLNGETQLSDDRKYVVGDLVRSGQGGGALYIAPRAMLIKADNPVAISVELKLKQKGVIMLVSNLTMVEPENEFKVNGKNYKNAFVSVVAQGKDQPLSMHMWENTSKGVQKQGTIQMIIDKDFFTGTGTYVVKEDDKDPSVTMTAYDGTDSYGDQWSPPRSLATKYGPISVTITEYGGPGKPIGGRITATLHRQVGGYSSEQWEHISVSAKFRVTNNYFQGG